MATFKDREMCVNIQDCTGQAAQQKGPVYDRDEKNTNTSIFAERLNVFERTALDGSPLIMETFRALVAGINNSRWLLSKSDLRRNIKKVKKPVMVKRREETRQADRGNPRQADRGNPCSKPRGRGVGEGKNWGVRGRTKGSPLPGLTQMWPVHDYSLLSTLLSGHLRALYSLHLEIYFSPHQVNYPQFAKE